MKVEEVFTPRETEVNNAIYIKRPELEDELIDAINGTLHVWVYGDSGNGKSWLCKKVLQDLDALYITANCANASRLKSLTQEIYNASIPKGTKKQQGFSVEKTGEAGIFSFLTSGLAHKKDFSLKSEEPLLEAFQIIRKKARKKLAVILIDNLESIFDNQEIMSELADIIILLDDSRYASYKIRLLFIGVPSGIIEYFNKTKNMPTIANRIQEISEVSNLSQDQVFDLVEKGFVELLGINISNNEFKLWKEHIYNVTLGVAQRVHEYCLELGKILRKNSWNIEEGQLENADKRWLTYGMKESFQLIETLMNERETKTGRRNQVLFALSKVTSRNFSIQQIEEIVRKEFPKSTDGVSLAIGQIMGSSLSGGEQPIIKRTSTKSILYEFTDPRYLMCLRVALKKENEKVIKIEL